MASGRIEMGVNALVAVETVNEFRRTQKPWKVLSFASPQATVAEPTEATTLADEPVPSSNPSGNS